MTQEAFGRSCISGPLGAYISERRPPRAPVALAVRGVVERGLRHPCHLPRGAWEALGQAERSKRAMGPGNATRQPSAAPSAGLPAA